MDYRQPLNLFECTGTDKHRVYRTDKTNNAPCSRCGSRFVFLVTLERNEDETEVQHHVRCLSYKKPRVN